MGENSKIEWCHHTFNPWTGCQKVSPGCDHCYAEGWAKRSGVVEWGPHGIRRLTSPTNWKQPRKWNAAARASGIRARVFCASLADVFDNQVPAEWRRDLFDLIAETPDLDWLLLTKRPENIRKMLPVGWVTGTEWSNVWLGTTAENQEQANRRGRILRDIPARVRFFSCEPMLSGIEIELETIQALDWVICGGESGPGARPTHPDWARSLRDQCAVAGVHFHFKQWGEWADCEDWPSEMQEHLELINKADGNNVRVGKKKAGRLLDGVEHNGFPQVPA